MGILTSHLCYNVSICAMNGIAGFNDNFGNFVFFKGRLADNLREA